MIKISTIKNIVKTLLSSYSDLFFIKGYVSGGVILAVTFLNFNAGFSGLLAVFFAYIFALFIGYQTAFLRTGFYTYNALLVGLSIGFIFQISFLSILIIAIAGCLSLVVTMAMAHSFSQLLGLQILSIPFAWVSTLVYLSAASFTNLYVTSLQPQTLFINPELIEFLPAWLSGYFQSLGAIIFMPNVITGFFIAMILLLNSRILFILSISGFLFGASLHGLLTGSFVESVGKISNFNYILIAMGLGGIFNIPCMRSYTIAFIGVAVATLISSAGSVFWSQYGLPIFTLPFILITLSFIYILRLLNFPFITRVYKNTPEENLEYFLTTTKRFMPTHVAISLPFAGTWHVWQGFDGRWTHKGAYKHAYDFVICDADNQTHANSVSPKLSDYYAFGKQILSPINGRIIRVINCLPDNAIGSVDAINNWGNEIIIEDSRGFYIKIAHFAYQSISVVEGQFVEVGSILGLCGNSGNSPEPHIHIQAQATAYSNSATIDFVFVNYGQNEYYNKYGLPKINSDITNYPFDLFYDQTSNFVLNQKLNYDIYHQDQKIDNIELTVTMSDVSTYYLSSPKGKLYFGKQYGNFYFYSLEGDDPYLKLIFLSLPCSPLSFVDKLKWRDTIGHSLIFGKLKQSLVNFLNIFYPKASLTEAEYQYSSRTKIIGTVTNKFFDVKIYTEITLNPASKFSNIKVGDYELKLN